ncbi:hypothetical protein HPB52_011595 [Rhipicephalus sanguineus]|uniref:SGNH hydrolase-type esterase domain-containing protein n=1 Tax=Rhipicephalus sanguineus TaxID=34632 RepID=A0A9D4T9M5_RHISA|nr:hypothetical protein HPB52_011595 [Rhipicephalus sanguineus]
MGPKKTASKRINWKYPNASPSLTVVSDSQTKHIYQYFDPSLVDTSALVSQCRALISDVPALLDFVPRTTLTIVLHVGTNDIVRVSAQKAFQNYCQLVNEIAKMRPEITRIYASLILPRTTNRRQRYSNAAFIRCFNEEAWYFNELVKKSCAHSRLAYFLDHGFKWLPPHRVLAADGLHPNFEGVSLMACHIRHLFYKTFNVTSRSWSDGAPSSPRQERARTAPEMNKPPMSTPPRSQTVNGSPSESTSPSFQRPYTNNASKNRPECTAALAAPVERSPSALHATDASRKGRRYELRSTYAQVVQASPAN